MGRPHAAPPPRGGSNANQRPLVALMGCILVACAGILLISRTGEQSQQLSPGGDRAGEQAGRRAPSSVDGEVTSRIAGAVAARNRRRAEERLAEAAATAAAATGAVGAVSDGDEDKESESTCAARQPPQHLPDLGFDYPELRALKRRLRRALACSAGCPLSAVRRAYASALDEALSSAPAPPGGGAAGGAAAAAAGGGYSAGPGGLLQAYRSPSDTPKRASAAVPSSSCEEEAAARELRAFVRGALAALLPADASGGDQTHSQQQQQQQQQQEEEERATATTTTTAATIAAAAAVATAPASGPLPPSSLEQLARCPRADPTLPAFPAGARLLLAANLRDAGRAAPSAAVQAVRLALALPPGGLAVGAHEGGSSDRTPFALSVLRLMLLPLRVPHNVTVGGAADPPGGAGTTTTPPLLSRIERMAALRNAALAPWLGPWAAGDVAAVDALALGVLPGLAEEEDEEEEEQQQNPGKGGPGRAAATAAAQAKPPPRRLTLLAHPDVVAFANDAFFCAEDVLRLAAHRAPIACGFDFYSAPWQVAAAAEAGERRARQGAAAEPRTVAAKEEQRDDDDDDEGLEDPSVRRDYEEDYADEELREPKQKEKGEREEQGGRGEEAAATEAVDTAAAATATAETAAGEGARRRRRKLPRRGDRGAARFYDKWVSRDRAGGRLSNRPPYVRDEASAEALGRGMPVAASCCWNGLALLDAAPLGGTGGWALAATAAGQDGANTASAPPVVFRADGHPHDCPASSECSLLCDDYRRHATATTTAATAAAAAAAAPAAPYRAVLDPAVRLAYDPAQSRALFFGGGGERRAGGPPPPIPGFDVAPVDRALGPRRPWAEVADAAAALASGAGAAVAPARVDCCGLRPGKNFVRFRSDCAPLAWRDGDGGDGSDGGDGGGGGLE